MIKRLYGSCAIVASVTGMVAFTQISSHAGISYDTRVLTGDSAPGTEPGVVYGGISSAPALNSSGQVAFKAFLSGPGVTNANITGVWAGGSGTLHLVTRQGNLAPGTAPDVLFNQFSPPAINDSGETAFNSTLTGAGTGSPNFSGLWSEGSGALGLVAWAGQAAAGAGAGELYSPFSFSITSVTKSVLNSAGQAAFSANLTGAGIDSTNDQGIWTQGPGTLSLIARKGQPAAGAGPGVVYSSLDFGTPTLNNSGQTVFRGTLTGAGVDGTNNHGIWTDQAGVISLLARAGDAAAATGPGVVYSDLGQPALNNTGRVAFTSGLSGPGVSSSNDRGIWSGWAGSLNKVVRAGESAPGTPPGIVYDRFEKLDINDTGKTAFVGGIAGSGVSVLNDSGIWSEDSSSIRLIARELDAAPGTTSGVRFSEFSNVEPVINGAGLVAFMGRLTGTGVDGTNDRGIWATDPNGLLTLIARSGDLFDVNDDPLIEDLRTISAINLATGGSNAFLPAPSFNDAGQIAFTLRFTDNSSGIFVATIPEPTTLGLLGVGAGLVVGRRGERVV